MLSTSCFALQGIFHFENIQELGKKHGVINEGRPGPLCKPNKITYQVRTNRVLGHASVPVSTHAAAQGGGVSWRVVYETVEGAHRLLRQDVCQSLPLPVLGSLMRPTVLSVNISR